MEHLAEVAQWRADWTTSRTVEEREQLLANRARWADEAGRAGLTDEIAEMAATFQVNDTNSNGVLTGAEFDGFIKATNQNAAARGLPVMSEDIYSEDIKAKIYALFNAQTADVDGISMADFHAGTVLVGAKVSELIG